MRILKKIIGYVLSILALLLIFLAVGILTLQWWIVPIAPLLAGWAGADIQSAEYQGKGALLLKDIQYETDGIEFHAARAELLLPTYWLWWGWRDQLADVTVFKLEEWNVALDLPVSDQPASDSEPVTPDLPGYFQQAMDFWKLGLQWVPNFALSQGNVHWNEQTFQVNLIQKQGRVLKTDIHWPEQTLVSALPPNLSLRAQLESANDNQSLRAQIEIPEQQLQADFQLKKPEELDTLEINGQLVIPAGPAQIQAMWEKGNWIPEQANIHADALTIVPADYLPQAPKGTVHAQLQAQWKESQYFFNLKALTDQPIEIPNSPHPLQPTTLQVSGHGNLDTLHLQALQADTEGLHLNLTSPLELQLTPLLPRNQAQLQFNLDLAKQPFIEAQGTVDATLAIIGTSVDSFNGKFSLQGNGIEFQEIAVQQLNLGGTFTPNSLKLAPSEIHFSQGHQVLLKELELDLVSPAQQNLQLVSSIILNDGYHIELVGEVNNQLADSNSDADSGVTNHNTLDPTTAVESNHTAQADTRKQSQAARTIAQLHLHILQEEQQHGELKLQAELDPATRSYGQLQLQGFLKDFSWLQQLSPELPDLTTLTLNHTTASLNWQDGPVVGQLAWDLNYQIPDQDLLEAKGTLQFTEQVTQVPHLLLSLIDQETGENHPVIELSAALPINLYPANSENPVNWREDDPWELKLELVADEQWIHEQMDHLPFKILSPQLHASLAGTPREPTGKLLVSSPELQLTQNISSEFNDKDLAPTIRDLHIELDLTPEKLELLPSGLQLMDTPLAMQASLPLTSGELLALLQGQSQLDLDPLSGYIRLEDFNIESVAPLLPDILHPQGNLSINLSKEPQAPPVGHIVLDGIATRPIGALGSLEGIQADIAVNEQEIILRHAQLFIGGAPVVITGQSEMPGKQELPDFRLTVKGENVPFVRSPGLILRADLDLLINNQDRDIPQIGGNLVLRDSISLIDLSQIESNPQSPSQRPPYFSVDVPLVKDWTLNLGITGNRFLRIRTPVLDGTLSTQVTLIGTLGEPQVVGNATLHDSRIKFPFAGFNVDQGTVTLNRSNPYDPELAVYASTEALGYNLQMQLTGTLNEPQLVFSSTPPLDSSQILLMVSTGQPPAGEVNRSAQSRLSTLGLYLGSGLLGSSGDDDSFFNRLSMESGQRISEQGKETMEIQYRITDRWSLIGEYDEFDAYNMDVKWKIFSK